MERHEEGSVANRPSYSKYILLSYHTLSDCFANGISKRAVLARLFVHDPSFHLGVVRLYSLLSPFPINRYVMLTGNIQGFNITYYIKPLSNVLLENTRHTAKFSSSVPKI